MQRTNLVPSRTQFRNRHARSWRFFSSTPLRSHSSKITLRPPYSLNPLPTNCALRNEQAIKTASSKVGLSNFASSNAQRRNRARFSQQVSKRHLEKLHFVAAVA